MRVRHQRYPTDDRRTHLDVVTTVQPDSPLGQMFANPTTVQITVHSLDGDENLYTHLERLERLQTEREVQP